MTTFSVNEIVLPRRSVEALNRGEPWIEWQDLPAFRVLGRGTDEKARHLLVANLETGEQTWFCSERLTLAPAGWVD